MHNQLLRAASSCLSCRATHPAHVMSLGASVLTEATCPFMIFSRAVLLYSSTAEGIIHVRSMPDQMYKDMEPLRLVEGICS